MISLYKYYCLWQYCAKVQVDKISQAKVLARIRRADMCVCVHVLVCISMYACLIYARRFTCQI